MNQKDIFDNWHWGECLEYLSNITAEGDNIVLLHSEADGGKTTLKQSLTQKLSSAYCKVFSISGEQKIGVATMVRQITMGFGLVCNNEDLGSWSELQKVILADPYGCWVLVVDDAEKLSWDILNSLISLYSSVSSEASKFSLILFSESKLVESLKKSVLKDFVENKFNILQLKELTFTQMEEYLSTINLNFNRKVLKKIYHASGGLIGKVKQLAISEIKIKQTENSCKLSEKLSTNALLANIINPPTIRIAICCGLLVLAYIIFLLVQKEDNNWLQLALNFKSVEVQEPKITKQNYPQNQNQIDTEEMYQKLYADLSKEFQLLLNTEIHKLENKITKENDIKNNKNKNFIDKPTIVNVKPKPIESIEKNILNIEKNRYTLQIMTAKHENSIKQLFNNYPAISKHAKYFVGKFRSSQLDSWYILVYGNYNSKEEAVRDLEKLPIYIQSLKPIIRDYGAIHSLINNQQEYPKSQED